MITKTVITREEYNSRIEALQRAVADSGLDVILITSEESIYYLTGASYLPFERPFFIIVRAAGPVTRLMPVMELQHLGAIPVGGEILTYWDYPSKTGENWFDRLDSILEGTKRVGIEPSVIAEVYEKLKKYSPVTLPLVENLRLVKSPAEVAMMRTAARYADAGMEKVIGGSYKGITVIETFTVGSSIQTRFIKETTFQPLASKALTVALPAPFSANPHGVPDVAARLGVGPNAAASVMKVNGYTAECERIYFHGDPGPDRKEVFAVMTEARKRAFATVRPGVTCQEVDLAANEFLREKGYGSYLLHRVGHGLGQGNHEGPWLSQGSDTVLKENMIISIEPGIYIPELGGFRHSDTVLVTAQGYECLTQYPTDLESLTVRGFKPLKRLKGSVIRRMTGIR